MLIHVVQRGETLWSIANRYGFSINQLAAANQIPNPDVLVIGQTLVIPTPNNIHVVKPGETLWAIAKLHGTTVEAIVQDNGIINPSAINIGQVLRIRLPVTEVNGYLGQMGEAGRNIVRDIGRHLTYLSTFSYKAQPDGSLIPTDDTAVLEAARGERAAAMMTLTNFAGRKFSTENAHAILNNVAVQDILIGNIISSMQSKGYRGLNVDFEYVLPADREAYNRFLHRLVDRLHPLGYFVSSALAPKITAGQIGLLYEAHDYPAHGQILDFVVLMTYEWGWAGGRPTAIAPINEVRRVLDYAVTVIPRNKILMGAPTYGRDWKLPYVQGVTLAETISPQEAIRRAAQFGVSIQYNIQFQSPFYRYTDGQGIMHEVWFEDARSAQAKMDTVKQYGLRGISYWELSSPFPQEWLVLEGNFQVRKLV